MTMPDPAAGFTAAQDELSECYAKIERLYTKLDVQHDRILQAAAILNEGKRQFDALRADLARVTAERDEALAKLAVTSDGAEAGE